MKSWVVISVNLVWVGAAMAQSPAPQDAAQKATAEAVVALVNVRRAENGCGPLKINAQLTVAAQGHSRNMAEHDFFSHTGHDGSRMADRVSAAGYNYSMAAENIGMGYKDAEAAVEGWMNSPGHRANILNCALSETGVGYYYQADDQPMPSGYAFFHYWTQVFGKPMN